MKASKLDAYKEIIINLVKKGKKNREIRHDLSKLGCDVGRETIRETVDIIHKSGVIQGNRRAPGRPKKSSKKALSFLPDKLSNSSEEIEILHFFRTLLNTNNLENKRSFDSLSLMLLGIDGAGLERFRIWAREIGREGVDRLGDFELCLLTYLGAGIGPVPAGKSESEITLWLEGLIRGAVQLRTVMRAEVGLP